MLAISLPMIVDGKLVGTCFVAGNYKGRLIFLSTLHHLGRGLNFFVGVPPNNGDISVVQRYPISKIQTVMVDLIHSDPIKDVAVLIAQNTDITSPIPRFLDVENGISVGEEVLLLGYPYVSLGSILETAEVCHISALGQRLFMEKIPINEFIISHQTLVGSSGSPVIRRSDGVVCGMLRGCLAPPDVISIGNIPLGTDSNITYVINSIYFKIIIEEAIGRIKNE